MISRVNKNLSFKFDEKDDLITAIYIFNGKYPAGTSVIFENDAFYIGNQNKVIDIVDAIDDCEILFAQDGVKSELDKEGNLKITKAKK